MDGTHLEISLSSTSHPLVKPSFLALARAGRTLRALSRLKVLAYIIVVQGCTPAAAASLATAGAPRGVCSAFVRQRPVIGRRAL